MQDANAVVVDAKKSILVVDDHDSVRWATVFMIRMLGHQVLEANCSEEAIRCFQQMNPPQILITDIHMPGEMDGLGLRAWIRLHHPEVPVILTSGNIDTQPEKGSDFLRKPYTLKAMQEILKRHVAC